ncbi:hypothetical protein IQ215_04820 [Cyanobacterium stanieri LEGE 03274]|uniref:Uncharacterized protein n=1 Tax=Cyanobacterium stanieri LEGE 03274 TaxID=1828756 RepID=A0ABR9V292_9CHRO|nr:hypothetical protein [Cyanobacterium stanieri]MBE9222015.1 hypothetical protein [Cyanobacterium stanieri LEGE 03274]
MNLQNQFNNPVSIKIPQQIEEVTLGIAIQNFNPTMVSPEFLQMGGIIPSDWEVAQKPVVSANGTQIMYKNGLKIIAQRGLINFIEGLANKDSNNLSFAKVAMDYVKKLSNAQYQGLSISPKIIVPLSGDEGAGRRLINQEFLKQGNWSQFEGVEPQAALNLFYNLPEYSLAVNINPARLQQSNNTVIAAILFAGNFTYKFDQIQGADNQLNMMMDKINGWQDNLNTFRVLVNEKFLHQAISYQESLFDN